MSILSIQGVRKHFSGLTVLDGVDMEIEKGKMYQLIGPNGSGKTTLINVVSGLLKLDDGAITFDGNDITHKGLLETYKTGLVRTFQIPQPFTKLTTMENFLTLGIAAGVGGGLGLLTSYPAIRLRGDYLAITLLAFGESIRIIGNNFNPLVGGTLGVQVPDPLSFLPGELRFPIATIGLVLIAIVVFLYSERLIRSPLGRMLRAVRDNEVAAESLGKNASQIRIKIIMVSAALAAIGGALYAFYVGGTIAFAYDRASWTFWPFLMILIGGLANNKGVIIGTLLFVTLRKFIIFFKDSFQGFVPFDVIWLDFLLLGIILLAVLLYRPQGIFAEKSTPTISFKDNKHEEQNFLKKIKNLFS